MLKMVKPVDNGGIVDLQAWSSAPYLLPSRSM